MKSLRSLFVLFFMILLSGFSMDASIGPTHSA